MTEAERFWCKVAIADDAECWNWQAYINKQGYGEFHFRRRAPVASRVAWILTYGEISDGLHVLHHCDNRRCVNPKHLYLGTNKDNVDDRERRGRRRTGWVPGEANGSHVLTNNDVREIRELHANGWTLVRLHERFGVSCTRLSLIVRGLAWTHLLETK